MKRTQAILVTLFLMIANSAAGFAQNDTTSTRRAQDRDRNRPYNLGTLRTAFDTIGRSMSEATGSTLLDRAVDRGDYILGPGDVVDVSIFGELNQLARLTVSPEGTIVIPAVGIARVHPLNLNEAEEEVSTVIRRQYRNIKVSLSLASVRSFKVFLLGEVTSPGVRIASAATRVSEIAPLSDTSGVMRRNIILRRTNGDTTRIDLLRFAALGDLSANPRLRDGDAIFVPTIAGVVHVVGRFANPAIVEYRVGETLADLITLANAGREFLPDAADTIRLSRVASRGGGREIMLFTQSEAAGGQGSRLLLQPFDAIYVAGLSDYGLQPSATILGQVLRPGTYPILEDTTTVRELVAMAGGFGPDAAIAEALLYRTPRMERRNELESIPADVLTRDERRILQAKSATDPNSVALDFARLLAVGGQAFDQKLARSDTLYIPRLRDEVTVLGAVVRPGIVTFAPGSKAEYFVKLAGGYTKLADRSDAVVLRARTGARLDAGSVKALEPGDQIIVPFRERVTLTERLQRTQGVVGTISALVVTFLGIRQIID